METPEQEVTRILSTWPESERLAGVLRVVSSVQQKADEYKAWAERVAGRFAQLDCAVAMTPAQALAEEEKARGAAAVHGGSVDSTPKNVPSPEPLLALAEAVVEAARAFGPGWVGPVTPPGAIPYAVENVMAKIAAYDAARDAQAKPSGVVNLRGAAPDATFECVGPAPRQYSATCRHALWLIGSCPECHGEATQYKPPNEPDHFVTLPVGPWLSPQEQIQIFIPTRSISNRTVHSKRARACIQVESELTENDYVAGPLADWNALPVVVDTCVVRVCPHCRHEIHIEVETRANSERNDHHA